MTIGIGVDLILFVLIAISFGVYKYSKSNHEIYEYENSFIQEHITHKPSHLLKLEFDERDTAYFLRMCRYVVKLNKPDRHPPQLENHFLTFKEATSHFYYVEMIRCTKSIAIIAAKGYYHCAYVLKETKRFKELDDKKFRIHHKLCYFDQTENRSQITMEPGAKFEKDLQGINETESEFEYEAKRDHELDEGTPIRHPEGYQARDINSKSGYQAENFRSVYVSDTEPFDRSKTVRRWSSAERDVYDADRDHGQPASSDEEHYMYPGYQPYPPDAPYNKHPAQVVNDQVDVMNVQ